MRLRIVGAPTNTTEPHAALCVLLYAIAHEVNAIMIRERLDFDVGKAERPALGTNDAHVPRIENP